MKTCLIKYVAYIDTCSSVTGFSLPILSSCKLKLPNIRICSHCLFLATVSLQEQCCYHLFARLMTVSDSLKVVATKLIQAVCNKFLRACLLIFNNNNLCYVQILSDFLEQLVTSLLASIIDFLKGNDILVQTCQ
jgi:hypothetical protein